MKLNKKLRRALLTVALALLVGAVAADNQALPGCKHTCGDVEIPYPFGMGTSGNKSCYLESRFMVTCNLTDSKLYKGKGNIQILHIDIDQNQMDVLSFVAKNCSSVDNDENYSAFLKSNLLSISSKANKFVTIGCDSYGSIKSFYKNDIYSTGCSTKCGTRYKMIDNGTCSGRGCCQVDIPPGMWNVTIRAHYFNDSTQSLGDCSYSFVVKNGTYVFSPTHIRRLPFEESRMVLDWTVGDGNCSASESICSNNSYCDDKDADFGYRCRCKDGYEGNPYHPRGCTELYTTNEVHENPIASNIVHENSSNVFDIDECATSNHRCITKENCNNTPGNHTCFCPAGQIGNGTRDGGGCQPHLGNTYPTVPIVLGVGAALIVLFVGTFSYSVYQKRKLLKLKEKFFQQNGGFILRQKLHQRNYSSQTTHIFKENELKKATNNYDESSIIGRGGFGTVFKGVLADGRIVAIKKSKTIDADQIEQFINEVDVVSQINHRNVVKLLGCCLETQVPLLVYEFVSNGTLSNFIHTDRNENTATWKTRLRIATEVAGALSYLHSAASIPIIHRDVKSDNILLDENHTAKVSDFGASRLIPLDQTEVATMVQGTIGYLDPEYMQTSQLTEKSDVYSFGVVLVELLTGEKPFSFCRLEEKRMLSMHFLSCLKKDCLFEVILDGILNEENKQEIKEVAILASKCLRLEGEERPSMKEVAMELEGMRLMEKHSWIHSDSNLEETRCLLHEASSSIYEFGGSSKHGDTGYDSLKDHVQLVVLDDGR